MNHKSLANLFAVACQRHDEGNWSVAEQTYRQLLGFDPRHHEAWHRLGVLTAQLGRFASSVEYIQQAISIEPTIAEYHTNLAMALFENGQFERAIDSNRRALKFNPNCASTHFNLGTVYEKQKNLTAAASSYEQALRLQPTFLEAKVNLGNVQKAQWNLTAASQSFQDAIRMQPNSPEAYYNLASVLHRQLEYDAAIETYRRAIQLNPQFAPAFNNLGSVFADIGKHREAVEAYQHAVLLQPDYVDCYYNLGVALNSIGQTSRAFEMFQKTIDLKPDHVEALYHQGGLLKDRGLHEEAIVAYQRALTLRPGYGEIDMLNQMQQICRFAGQEEIAHRLVEQMESESGDDPSWKYSPLAFLNLPIATTAAQQYRCARRWQQGLKIKPFDFPSEKSKEATSSGNRLRIGYLSADLRTHPVGYLIPECIEAHDRNRFEVYAYNLGHDDSSPIRRRLEQAFDYFRDIRESSFREAAQTIRDDGIDILIDLQGYTFQARTQILAYRPALIQVNYLGFAGTMGADFVDYILADDYVIPVDQHPYFTEKIYRLPGSFMVNDSQREISSEPLRRSDFDLPDKAFVMCAFSTTAKITQRTFDAWCRLLESIDRSVLWLRSNNPIATTNLKQEAATRGIDEKRLIFASTVPMSIHLARHRLADVFLDTFPYNQHSSASDAIRTGLPLITIEGETFPSRVAGGLLRALGLPELVTKSFHEYEALVKKFAEHPYELKVIRHKQAENLRHTDMYDGKAFAKKLETAFLSMFESWRRGDPTRPTDATAELRRGLALQESGRLEEAIQVYREIVRTRPDFVEGLNNLASALKSNKQLDEAIQTYREALRLGPEFPELHYNLANALSDDKRYREAAASYQQAIQLKPDFVEAHNNLGDAYREQGLYEAAVESYRRTIELQPSFTTTYNNLANALVKLGRLDEAIATFHRAVSEFPDRAEVYNNLGNAYRDHGQIDAATEAFQKALSLRPNYAEAYFNLGNLQAEQGQIRAAIQSFQIALEIEPSFTTVASALVHQLQMACDWKSLPDLTSRLISAAVLDEPCEASQLVSPLSFIGLTTVTTAEQQFRCARRWAKSHFQAAARPLTSDRSTNRESARTIKDKLRVGYLSADFREHPVAMLIVELIEVHARDQFEIFGYSIGGQDTSPLRRRLESAFDHFRDLTSMSFDEAAQTIAEDRIDILIDLQGYTNRCRTEILARRPAPIQVNYLGFPGTMGTDFIDYILVDDFIASLDQQAFFSERLVHLPGCFMVNDSQREIDARTPTRDELGLPADGFVFCAFNSSFKVTEVIFECWLRLLKAVPKSVLWLRDWNELAVNNLRQRAEARGLESERLIFAPMATMPFHLARHRAADLFLDTFPYNQHSTAADALRVGLPLVTLAGNTFASRVAGSLLRALELDELVAHSLNEYENLAFQLASDARKFRDVRQRLAKKLETTELFHGRAFARHLEQALREMWKRHVSGEPPIAFDVPLSKDSKG